MKTVGVAGCQRRIGTTTQALQMVLCLQCLEYEVAYVEMGKQGYIRSLKELYKGITQESSHIKFRDIDMYEASKITDALKNGYEYLVKDYGNVTDQDFQKISFLEQDIKIMVGGVKANEIEFVEQVLGQSCYDEVSYIFNFVALEEQQDIKGLMGEHGSDTYFSIYAPDPFTYMENDIYPYLLGE